jgi:hypothetical protein
MTGRRVIYLLAAVAAVAAAMVLPGTASAANPSCGSTVTTNLTLSGNMDCSASGTDALIVGADNITIDLGGYTLTVDPSYEAIDNYDGCSGNVGCSGLTVTNGTISGGNYGVDSEGDGSHQVSGTTVSSLKFVSQGTTSIYLHYTADSNVSSNTVTDLVGALNEAIEDERSSNDVIQGNTLTGYQTEADNSTYGIYTTYTGGLVISGNTIKAMGEEGWYDDNYSAGMTVYGNVFAGNNIGIELDGYNIGDMISGNYIKNSTSDGLEDYYSNYQTYTGNVVSSNAGYGLYLYPDDYGVLNASNNVSRFNGSDGVYIYEAYNDEAYGGPTAALAGWNTITGNTSLKNDGYGFYDYYSYGETWTNNSAMANTDSGFYLDYPMGAAITSNTAKYNDGEGFDFEDNYSYYGPASVSNNVAQYNTDYGFYGGYPVAGSGNTGGGTNSTADCYQFAGCS